MKSRIQPGTLTSTLLVLCLAASCGEPRQRAERIFINARVVTMNDGSPAAEAFAVADGKIIAVGTSQELRARFSGAPSSDLEGKSVMPGIIESHGHLLNLGQSAMELNLVGVATPEGAAEKVAEKVAQTPPGEWIIGWGWDEGAWASNYPTNYVLNQVAPKHPVWLKGLHGFAGWANAKALEVAGVRRGTPDPENGRILKDSVTGVPTGILLNQAQSLVSGHIPPLAPAKIEEALMLAQQRCLEHGLTSVHDANVTRPVLEALHACLPPAG